MRGGAAALPGGLAEGLVQVVGQGGKGAQGRLQMEGVNQGPGICVWPVPGGDYFSRTVTMGLP